MPKHPTKPDRYAALETYVAACLPVLNLGNWKVTILTDVAPEDRYADIEPNDQAQTANLRVGNLFWAQKPDEQRLTIVHELIHLHQHHRREHNHHHRHLLQLIHQLLKLLDLQLMCRWM